MLFQTQNPHSEKFEKASYFSNYGAEYIGEG